MPGSDLRLLALDGGGVRGLSSLMILEQLMEAVNPDNPPLPCEYFDMIGGTSTGGLIAIMLGRLKMSVGECIKAYVQLSERVFQKSRHRVKINGKLQGRFDAEELVRAVKEVVKQKNQPEDALLKDEPNATCKVFVCATSKETCGTVCLTSYRTSRGNSDLLNSVTIWEACRATSAATTFFDPIGVGRFGEEFVDGATGANNPVREVWGQAQLVWGPEPLEGKVKCLVSIGTGVPSLKPFKDDVLNIGSTLAAIATETEKTAEQFQSEHGLLDSTGRYYRFNVQRGLEDIGLEEAKKVREMAAATRQYILSYEVHKRMQACAGSISGRNYFGGYCTLFSLEGVPQTHHFVERPTEMAQLERVLLPQLKHKQRQKIYVLHGLGGMGKTQLAVEFARRHHEKFSSVFWLDGQSEDILKRSIARCAARIPEGQINETSRTYAADGNVTIDAVVKDVLAWLALPDNTAWLLVFDNVDREYTSQGGDPEAYDIRRFLSGADHGSVLVTTRLARLEQLGESQQLGRVSAEQGQAILESWYKENHSTAESERLLAKLGGLPLAIAQAGAYLQETGVGLVKYLEFYERQWDELMKPDNPTDAPLLDYPDRSVWTTWTISYQAILKKQPNTAHLLLLWSFLDNKDLWYGLFAAASANSPKAGWVLSAWIGDIASSEVKFSKAMQMLRNYSLAEKVAETSSYTTHPVVHQWAHHSQGRSSSTELSRLATIAVGFAVPPESDRDSIMLRQRLLPHAQVCFRRITENEADWWLGVGNGCRQCDGKCKERELLLHATHFLALLYDYQGRLRESEQMFKRALRGFERNFGPYYEITLYIMVNLGDLYRDQSRLEEAEQMYEQALPGFEATMPNTVEMLQLFDKLGSLYRRQGRLDEAEQMHERALRGVERKLGPNDETTLRITNNTGLLYEHQDRLDDAKQMYERALREEEEKFGRSHPLTLQTVSYLGDVYQKQGKSDEAKQMYERALQGYEEVFGSDGVQQHLPALDTIQNLGHLYLRQKNLTKGHAMYVRALSGLNDVLGPSHERCKELAAKVKHLVDDHLSHAGREEEVVLNQESMVGHLYHASKEREGPSNEESAALVARSNELSVSKKQVEQQCVVDHSPHAGTEREALLNKRNTESAADELSIIRKEEEEVSRLPTRVGEPAVQQGKRKN